MKPKVDSLKKKKLKKIDKPLQHQTDEGKEKDSNGENKE